MEIGSKGRKINSTIFLQWLCSQCEKVKVKLKVLKKVLIY